MAAGNNAHSLGDGTALRMAASGKALLVELETGDEVWIPISCLHDDSEVYDADDCGEGEVIVKEWWAEKNGLL
jgi:hypothetical protein